MDKQKKDLTVFIGRFSPFHNGHAEVLRRALETSHLVLVLIGSSGQARTTKNPFTFEERKQMINDYVSTLPVGEMAYRELIIEPLYDHPYNDQAWIRGVQDAVHKVKSTRARMDDVTVYLTGCDRDDTTWYLNAFGDLFKKDFVSKSSQGLHLSATNVRKILFGNGTLAEVEAALDTHVPKTTLNFLLRFKDSDPAYNDLVKEYQYIEKYKKSFEAAPYPVTIQTVDTVVIQSGHVLVCVRDNFPGYGLWCLPGGHLDVEKKERLLDAAIRELDEETKIELSKAQLYGSVKDKEVFDHPDRSLKGRVITMAYLLKLDDSKPLPKVKPQRGEIKKVMWVPISEALSLKNMDKWFDDHYHILTTMYGRLPTNG